MRKSGRALLALAVSGGLLSVPATAVAAPPATGSDPSGTVTLLTGDRVELRGGKAPIVTRGEGRGTVPMLIDVERGRWTVMPLDAAKLVAEGRLDKRLFDVTTLLEWGYDDAKQPATPLIVEQPPGMRIAGTTTGRPLPAIGASVVEASKKDTSFWKSLTGKGKTRAAGIGKVWVNGIRKPLLDKSTAQIGAPSAWQNGLTGKGVEVAVLDTGVDTKHPDLAGKVVAAKNFTADPDGDRNGHGTHVASIIGGTGAASAGRFKGVAPEVALSSGKVCAGIGCREDAILAGMEWAAAERKAPVVNLSIGGNDAIGSDPLEAAVNRLSGQHGTLFVIAAGNSGPDRTSMETPGTAAAALTVGATDHEDRTARFSSRGPSRGDSGLKPDIAAPGVEISAAASTESKYPGPYVAFSGTSMATPHVAGAAAVLRQRHPGWNGGRLKETLMATAKPGDDVYAQGAGRVDVARATSSSASVTPASVDFGLMPWPSADDEVVTKTVTYRNDGDKELSLDIALRAEEATPFKVNTSKLTVPARGVASVQVTVDTRAPGVPTGALGARVIATADGVALSTPVGVEKEDERYALNLTHLSRGGEVPAEHVTVVDRIGDCEFWECRVVSASPDPLRLRPGRYSITEFSRAEPGAMDDVLYRSLIEVKGDTALTLDARLAKPVAMTAPDPAAKLTSSGLLVLRNVERPESASGFDLFGEAGQVYRMADLDGPRPPADAVFSQLVGHFAVPDRHGNFADTSTEYNLATSLSGRAFTGLDLRPRAAEFTAVRTELAKFGDAPARAVPAYSVEFDTQPGWLPLDVPPMMNVGARYMSLPSKRTVHFLAKGMSWTNLLQVVDANAEFLHAASGVAQRYAPGASRREVWNKGVFGPQFGSPPKLVPPHHYGVQRQGDLLTVGLDMFADSDLTHQGGRFEQKDGTMRLLRDGKVIGDWSGRDAVGTMLTLPPEAAAYRLERSAKMSHSPVSTEVTGAWTFRSGQTDKPVSLPLSAVRYTPELGDDNRARPGRDFAVPILVQRQTGSAAAEVKSLEVQVSYDDGRTWRPAPLSRRDGQWCAKVDNPAGGTVSLRATAEDTAGNKVEQTIVRAYLVR